MESQTFLSLVLEFQILNYFLTETIQNIGSTLLDLLIPFVFFFFLPPNLFINFSPEKNNNCTYVVQFAKMRLLPGVDRKFF